MFNFLKKHRIFSQIILVLIVLTFALFGVDSYLRGRDATDVVAEIGSAGISQREYGIMVSQAQDRLRPQAQQNPQAAEYLQSDAFKRSVLNEMIQRRVLLNQAAQMGMAVSENELREVIGSVSAFFDENGQFSAEKYEQLLRAQNLSPAEFERQIEQDLIVGRLQNTISETAIVADSTVRRLVKQRGQQREVSQLIFSPVEYREKITVTEEDTKKYFDDNKDLFKLPERARVEYLVLNEEAAAETVSVTDAELEQSYNERLAEFQTKEERRASHILISVAESASSEEKNSAKKTANEVLAKLQAKESSFAELAKQFSNDPGSAENGGDLGFFEKGLMVESFDEAVFSASVGEIQGPIETQYGFHIIRLDEIKPLLTTPFDEVKEQLEKDIKQSKVEEAYIKASQTFSDLVYTEFDSLQPVADELKLTIQTSDWVSRDSAGFNTLLDKPELLQAIFSAEALDEKRNTQAFEVQPKTLVAARVVEHALETDMAYEDVSEEIQQFLQSKGALDMAISQGTEALETLKKGEQLSDAEWSKPQMVTMVKRQGLHPEGLKAVYGVGKDELPAHVGMEIDDGRYVIFKVSKIVDMEEVTEDDMSTAKEQLVQMVKQQQMSAYIASLRDKASVRIKGDLFSDQSVVSEE
jgi:peptidyl-prolyl cis-trans isomerase D